MKRILRISLLAAVGACLALAADAEEDQRMVASFSSYDFRQGKRYKFDVYQKDLTLAPPWKTEEAFPPLSPRRAEMSARGQLKELVTEPDRWSRGAIALHQLSGGDRWIYVVHFSGFQPPGVIDGAVPQMRIVVLMDGNVIKPTVTPHGKGNTPDHCTSTSTPAPTQTLPHLRHEPPIHRPHHPRRLRPSVARHAWRRALGQGVGERAAAGRGDRGQRQCRPILPRLHERDLRVRVGVRARNSVVKSRFEHEALGVTKRPSWSSFRGSTLLIRIGTPYSYTRISFPQSRGMAGLLTPRRCERAYFGLGCGSTSWRRAS